MKRSVKNTLAILTLIALFLVSATAVNAMRAEIISNMGAWTGHVTMDDHSYTNGDTVEVYTELYNVNYKGYIIVDLFYVITDPQEHVVVIDNLEVNRRTYEDDVNVMYTRTIPDWWLYGRYGITIYSYNRLNKAEIAKINRKLEYDEETLKKFFDTVDDDDDDGVYNDMTSLIETGCGGNRDDLEDVGVVKSIDDSLEEIAMLQFYVRSPEEIQAETPSQPQKSEVIEGTKFVVTNMQIDQFTVKPNEPVAISVAVKNEGERGTERISLLINGKKEAEAAVTVGSGDTETLHFLVSKELPGTYKVTIPGTDIVKLFFVKEGEEDVEELIQESSPSTTIDDVIQESADESTEKAQTETQESPLGGDLLWGLFASSNNKEFSTENVLLSSVFDLICNQISLTKVVSFFVA
ncbi:MAG: hypothetical protein U9R10_02140 [Euryarchaeota archaeon]|nr:hypothetical protein [Euryarchaeota archaeon]